MNSIQSILIFIFFWLNIHIDSYCQDAQKSNNTIDASGNIRCSNGASISVNDLLQKRAITAPSLSYNPLTPSNCISNVQIDDMIERFKQEDKANIQSLANNFCSHQAGWVEFDPGTCSAGGPPPICVANHWHKVSFQDAMSDYEVQAKKIALERAAKLNEAKEDVENSICSCWVNVLQKQDNEATNKTNEETYYQKGVSAGSGSSNIKFPCMDGCPPSYTCENGFCVQTAARPEDNYEKAKDKLYDKGKEMITEKVQDKATEELLKNMGRWGSIALLRMKQIEKFNVYITVGSATLDPKMIGGGNDVYMSKIADINSSIERLENYYVEFNRYQRGLNRVRDENLIKKDILDERNNLGSNLNMLYLYRKEAGFSCKGCCEQILDYTQDNISKYVTKMLNIKLD